VVAVEEMRADLVRPDAEHSGDAELVSPMPGSVVAVSVADGDTVEVGIVVVAVEAMKMEHALRSPVAGVVELLVAIGDQVTVGQPLARIIATTESES
jgi:acetyl-CoA/propionyl-CoA carboxylase biotin carboxyl carrier protein